MMAAIHQPNFIPWCGYFYKMLESDHFVFLDDVQYTRRGFTSRVKIKAVEGERWLTVPVMKKGRYDQSISEVELDPEDKWKQKILGTVRSCYSKAPYFKTYFQDFASIILADHHWLVELNLELIRWLAGVFDIRTPMKKSSELSGVGGASTERLVGICKALGAGRYLSGFGGQKYQDEEIFRLHHIQLAVYDFKHPVYPQLWGEFVPGLSAIDLLFNCGPQAAGILKEI